VLTVDDLRGIREAGLIGRQAGVPRSDESPPYSQASTSTQTQKVKLRNTPTPKPPAEAYFDAIEALLALVRGGRGAAWLPPAGRAAAAGLAGRVASLQEVRPGVARAACRRKGA
jgi:hypothetical protein